MSDRFLTVIGVVLVLFPFVSVFTVWKMWLAFGIGIVVLFSVLFRALRGGVVKK
ncbi:MAG: hypothetical protein OYG31_02630 [Candidatus Kaiserbacteria bacterium]|nr:hypothetical protein [Candidatus Kaiserbacteria bacterium]